MFEFVSKIKDFLETLVQTIGEICSFIFDLIADIVQLASMCVKALGYCVSIIGFFPSVLIAGFTTILTIRLVKTIRG